MPRPPLPEPSLPELSIPQLSVPQLSVPQLSVPQLSVPQLSVVVPAHDEAENVGPLLAEIGAALDGRADYELIVVDDGSADDTLARLLALARELPRLRVLRHRRRSGQSAGLATGIRAARAEWVVTLDGDGQNDPADVPRLLAVRDGEPPGSDLRMVTGYRRKRRDRFVKRAASRVANAVRGRLLNDHTPDTGCGLKLIHRPTFLALPAFDHMHRFLPALVQRAGGRVVSVEVSHRPRLAGRSSYGLWDRLWVGIVDMAGVMWLRRRPLRPEAVEETAGTGGEADAGGAPSGPSAGRG